MDIFKKMGGIVGCVLLTVPTYAGIKVNEVMPCNISTYMDKSVYDFPGWIELYNDGETESLKGYTLKHYKIKKIEITPNPLYILLIYFFRITYIFYLFRYFHTR